MMGNSPVPIEVYPDSPRLGRRVMWAQQYGYRFGLKETVMKIFDYLDQSRADYSVSEHEPAYSVRSGDEHNWFQC